MRSFLWQGVLALGTGFALGLCYAWIISPIRYIDSTPNTLRADFKDEFRAAIAAAYGATHNIERAKARLVLLGDPNPSQALAGQAQRMLANGDSVDTIQPVAALASDLRNGVTSIPPSTPSPPAAAKEPVTQAITQSPSAVASATQTLMAPAATSTAAIVSTPLVFDTPTPRPTRTPIPTAGAPFQLTGQDRVCYPNLTNGLLQIVVLDSHHHPMPGVEIVIGYSGTEEHFFTGLKPELGDGYADYIMQAGVTYAIRVGPSGIPVPSLSAPACPDTSGQSYTGGLKLTFQQQ